MEDLTPLERQILAELQDNHGFVAGGPDWCKILCAVKTAAAIVACAGNPVCIAVAVASGIACAKDCDR